MSTFSSYSWCIAGWIAVYIEYILDQDIHDMYPIIVIMTNLFTTSFVQYNKLIMDQVRYVEVIGDV